MTVGSERGVMTVGVNGPMNLKGIRKRPSKTSGANALDVKVK